MTSHGLYWPRTSRRAVCLSTDDSYAGEDIPRKITVLLYLDWRPERGGELRVRMPSSAGGGERTIEPRPGRLVAFMAQEVEHEVLPSEGERFAL